MIPPLLREAKQSRYRRGSSMKVYFHRIVSVYEDPTSELSDTEVAYGDILNDLAERGKFDEAGGELSEDDWADSQ